MTDTRVHAALHLHHMPGRPILFSIETDDLGMPNEAQAQEKAVLYAPLVRETYVLRDDECDHTFYVIDADTEDSLGVLYTGPKALHAHPEVPA